MSAPDELMHEFSVSFDYTGFDTFDDIARAMRSFADVCAAYIRGKDGSIKIVGFDGGSLECHLAANGAAWSGIQVMAMDLASLQQGQQSMLMPDPARKAFRGVLEHVKSLTVDVEGDRLPLGREALLLLDIKDKDTVRKRITHTGVLDRVDLKANQFRLMLPHGHRITCMPAMPFMTKISECLQVEVPRLKVVGDGNFRQANLLPASIAVRTVDVIRARPTLSEVVADITASLDREAVAQALREGEGS
jgi:hypothetical protein